MITCWCVAVSTICHTSRIDFWTLTKPFRSDNASQVKLITVNKYLDCFKFYTPASQVNYLDCFKCYTPALCNSFLYQFQFIMISICDMPDKYNNCMQVDSVKSILIYSMRQCTDCWTIKPWWLSVDNINW